MNQHLSSPDQAVFEVKKAGWRGIEVVFTGAMYAWGLVFPDPKVISGPGSIRRLPEYVRKNGDDRVLVITDPGLLKLGLLEPLLTFLKEQQISYALFSDVQQNPTIGNIEEALLAYYLNDSKAIIAVGGGSPMDCAKGVMSRVCRPSRPVSKMGGVFKIALPSTEMNGYLPPRLYAVPTTAGTGSETTFAAVITDPDTHNKFPIMDPLVRARYAVLDPELTVGLPRSLTATTGLDALTHAIEGYTNIWYNDRKFNQLGVKAIQLIFENLEQACDHPDDLKARASMLEAAYDAGMCFTRGGVGYVHGIGHRLGGLYGVPHGMAMSVILTHVYADDFLGPYAYHSLAELAEAVGIHGGSDKEKARRFMKAIRQLEDRLEIPYGFTCIQEQDIAWIAKECIKEVIPTYPVPHFFTQAEIENFIRNHLVIRS